MLIKDRFRHASYALILANLFRAMCRLRNAWANTAQDTMLMYRSLAMTDLHFDWMQTAAVCCDLLSWRSFERSFLASFERMIAWQNMTSIKVYT